MNIEHINKLVDDRYEECAALVIAHIKALGPEHRQSGDDSPLADVWEEFKSQLQEEESVLFWAYEHTIQQFCGMVVDSLSPTEFRLLWFWSDGYVEWNESEEAAPPYMQEDVVKELYWYVRNIAQNEDMACMIDDEDEDEESEDEEDEEDENSDTQADEPKSQPEYRDELPLFD